MNLLKILKIKEDFIQIGHFDTVPYVSRDVDTQKPILNISKQDYLKLQDLILEVYYG